MVYGAYRWNARTQELQARLGAARVPVYPRTVDLCELQCLPAPDQRYFRVVLKGGRPMVTSVRLQHRGTFNIGQITGQRKPFKSE